MSDRKSLLTAIEEERDSFVITYITSTRINLEVQMAMDSVRLIYEHLKKNQNIGKKKNIDLFIVSNGGDGTVPWRLVTLIREYAKKFSVLVPYRAFSAATLTALGADEIIMHPMGMLGPTDPTVSNKFNPEDKIGNKIGISVEDVTAYISLIKEDVGITHEDELVLAFNHLATQVHPLALGNVKRSLSQSRMMANKLLSLHMDSLENSHKINEIVDKLTTKLYFHGHPINRQEAKDNIGLKTIKNPGENLENLMWELFCKYEIEMRSDEAFEPAVEFLRQYPSLAPGEFKITDPNKVNIVYIESAYQSDYYEFAYQISGTKQPIGATQTQLIVNEKGWKRATW